MSPDSVVGAPNCLPSLPNIDLKGLSQRSPDAGYHVLFPAGVDWPSVERYVDMSAKLATFVDPNSKPPRKRNGVWRYLSWLPGGSRRRATRLRPTASAALGLGLGAVMDDVSTKRGSSHHKSQDG